MTKVVSIATAVGSAVGPALEAVAAAMSKIPSRETWNLLVNRLLGGWISGLYSLLEVYSDMQRWSSLQTINGRLERGIPETLSRHGELHAGYSFIVQIINIVAESPEKNPSSKNEISEKIK